MDQLELTATESSRIVPISQEKFAWDHFTIVVGMHITAMGALWFASVEAVATWLFLHFFFCIFGMSLGYHRLLSHRSFFPRSWVRNFLATMATLCFQGGPLFWAAAHRYHHAFTDRLGDPHSAARGFFWSHIGWLLYRNPNGFSYIKAQKVVSDLSRFKYLLWLERNSVRLNASVISLALVLFFALERLDLFFWMFPFRIVMVWHCTWIINSFSHKASFFSGNEKQGVVNNHLINFILPGEGMHKNHHERPMSPTNSFVWYQVDPPYWILKLFKRLKWVRLRKGTEL